MEDRLKNSDGTPKVVARKMLIITPEQISKLGLTSKIRSIITPQLKQKTIINRIQLKPQKQPKQTRSSNWRRESNVDENEMKLKLNSRFKELVSKKLPTDALEESSSAQLVKIKELITAPHKRGKKAEEPKPKPPEPQKLQLQPTPARQPKYIKVILPRPSATIKAVPSPIKENKVVLQTQSIPNLSVTKPKPEQKVQIVRNEVNHPVKISRVPKPVEVEVKKETVVKKPIPPTENVTLPSFSTFQHLAVNKYTSTPSKSPQKTSKVETKKSDELREELQSFISFQKAAKSSQAVEKKSSIPITTTELKRRLAKPMFVQFDPVTRKISKLEKGSPVKPLVLQSRVQENIFKEAKDTADVSKIIGKKIHLDSVDLSKMIKIELPPSQELALRLAMNAKTKTEPECVAPQTSKVSDIFTESDESQTTYEVLEVQVMGSDSPEAEEPLQVCREEVKPAFRNMKLPQPVKDRSKQSSISRLETKIEVKSPRSQLKQDLEELYEHELEDITASASKEASLEELALRELGLESESQSPSSTMLETSAQVIPEIEDPIEQALQKLHGVPPTPSEPAEIRNKEVIWESPETRGVVEDVETIEDYISQSEIRQHAAVESNIEESSQEIPDKVTYGAELLQTSEVPYVNEEDYTVVCDIAPIETEIVHESAEVLLETPDEDRGFIEDKSLETETHGRAELFEIEEVTSKSPLNRQPSEPQNTEFEEVMFDIRLGESAEAEIHDTAPMEAPENVESRSPKNSELEFEVNSLKTHDNDVGVSKAEEPELEGNHRVTSKSESEFEVTSPKTRDKDIPEPLNNTGIDESKVSQIEEALEKDWVECDSKSPRSRTGSESHIEETNDKKAVDSDLLLQRRIGKIEESEGEETLEKDKVPKSPRSRQGSESEELESNESFDSQLQRNRGIGKSEESESEETLEKAMYDSKSSRRWQGSESENESLEKDEVFDDSEFQQNKEIEKSEESETEEILGKATCDWKSSRRRQSSEFDESESKEIFADSPKKKEIITSDESEVEETVQNDKAMCDSKASRQGSESEESQSDETLTKDADFSNLNNRGLIEEPKLEDVSNESEESQSDEALNKDADFSNPNNRGLVEEPNLEDVSLNGSEVDKVICDSRSGEADIFYEEVVFSDSVKREVEESEEAKMQDTLETPEEDKLVCDSKSRQNSDSDFKETFDNYVFSDSGLPRNKTVEECEESKSEDVTLEACEKEKVLCDTKSFESREFVFEGTSNLGLPKNLDTFETAEVEISEKAESERSSKLRRNSDSIEFEFEEMSSETAESYKAASPRTIQISTESESEVQTPRNNDYQTTASEPKEVSMGSPEKLQDSELLTADELNFIHDKPESHLVQFASEEVVEETSKYKEASIGSPENLQDAEYLTADQSNFIHDEPQSHLVQLASEEVVEDTSEPQKASMGNPEKLQDSEYLTADQSNFIHDQPESHLVQFASEEAIEETSEPKEASMGNQSTIEETSEPKEALMGSREKLQDSEYLTADQSNFIRDEPESHLVQFVSEEVVEETVISEEGEVAEPVEVNTMPNTEAGQHEQIYQDWSVDQTIKSPMMDIEGCANVLSNLEVEAVTESETTVATFAEESMDVETSTEPEKLGEIMPDDSKLVESESEVHHENIQVQTNDDVTLEEVTKPENLQIVQCESKLQDNNEEKNIEVVLEEVTEPQNFEIVESESKLLQDKDEEIQMLTNTEVTASEVTKPEDFQMIESECKLEDRGDEIRAQTDIEVAELEDFQENESKLQCQDVEIRAESNNEMAVEEAIDIPCNSFEPSRDEKPEASRPLELDEAASQPTDETCLFEDILIESQIQSTENLQNYELEAASQEQHEIVEPKFDEGVNLRIHDQEIVERGEEIELQSSNEVVQLGEEVEMEQNELQPSDDGDLFDKSHIQLSDENVIEISKPKNVNFAEESPISAVPQIEPIRPHEDSQDELMEDVRIVKSGIQEETDSQKSFEAGNSESAIIHSKEEEEKVDSPKSVQFVEQIHSCIEQEVLSVEAVEESSDLMDSQKVVQFDDETESYLHLSNEEAMNLSSKNYTVGLPEECASMKSPKATENIQEQHGKADEITGMECTQVVEVNLPSQFQSAAESRLQDEIDGSVRLPGTELPEDLSLNPQRWAKHESQFERRNLMERSYNIDNYTGESQRAQTSSDERSPPKPQFPRRRSRTKPKVNLKSRLKRRNARPPSLEQETKDDYSLIDMELEETLDNAVFKQPSPCYEEYVAINESEIPTEEIDMTGFVSDKEVNRSFGSDEVIDYSSPKVDISKQYFSEALNPASPTATVLNSNLSESESKAEFTSTSKTEPDLESIRNEAKSLLYSFLTRREKSKSHSQDGSDTKKFKVSHFDEDKSVPISNTEFITSGMEETHNNVEEHSGDEMSKRSDVTCDSVEEFRKKRKRSSSQDRYRKRHFESKKYEEAEGQESSLPPICVEEEGVRNEVDKRVSPFEGTSEPRRGENNDGSDFFIRNFEKSTDRRVKSSSDTVAQNENTSKRTDFLDEGDHNHLLKDDTGAAGGLMQGHNEGTLEDCIVLPLEDTNDATSTSKENIVILRMEPLQGATERNAEATSDIQTLATERSTETMSDIQTLEAILSGSKTDKQTGDEVRVARAPLGRADSEDEMSNILRYMTRENSKRSAFIEEQRVEKQKALDEAERVAGGSVDLFFQEENTFLEQPKADSDDIPQKREEHEKELITEHAEINEGQKDLLLGNDKSNLLNTALEKEDSTAVGKEDGTTAEIVNESVTENLPSENADSGTKSELSTLTETETIASSAIITSTETTATESTVQTQTATGDFVDSASCFKPAVSAEVKDSETTEMVPEKKEENENIDCFNKSNLVNTEKYFSNKSFEDILDDVSCTYFFEKSPPFADKVDELSGAEIESKDSFKEENQAFDKCGSTEESTRDDSKGQMCEDLDDQLSGTDVVEECEKDGATMQVCDKPEETVEESTSAVLDQVSGTDIVIESTKDGGAIEVCENPDETIEESVSAVLENAVNSIELELKADEQNFPTEEEVLLQKHRKETEVSIEADPELQKCDEQEETRFSIEASHNKILEKEKVGHSGSSFEETDAVEDAEIVQNYLNREEENVEEKSPDFDQDVNTGQIHKEVEDDYCSPEGFGKNVNKDEATVLSEEGRQCTDKIVDSCFDQIQKEVDCSSTEIRQDVSTVEQSCLGQDSKEVEDRGIEELGQNVSLASIDSDEIAQKGEEQVLITEGVEVNEREKDEWQCADEMVDSQVTKEVEENSNECIRVEFVKDVDKDESHGFQTSTLTGDSHTCTDKNVADSCFDQIHKEDDRTGDSSLGFVQIEQTTGLTDDIRKSTEKIVDSGFDQVLNDGADANFVQDVSKDEDKITTLSEDSQTENTFDHSCFIQVDEEAEGASNSNSPEFVQNIDKGEDSVDSQKETDKIIDHSCFDQVSKDAEGGSTDLSNLDFSEEEDNVPKSRDNSCSDQVDKEAEDGVTNLGSPELGRVSQASVLSENGEKSPKEIVEDRQEFGVTDFTSEELVQNVSKDENSVSTTLESHECTDHSCFEQGLKEVKENRLVNDDSVSQSMTHHLLSDEGGISQIKNPTEVCHISNTEEDAGIEEEELEGFEEDCTHEYDKRIKEITVRKVSEEIDLLEDSIRMFVAKMERSSQESEDDDVICMENEIEDGISVSSSEDVGPSIEFKVEIKKSPSDDECLSEEENSKESIAMAAEAILEELAEPLEEKKDDCFSGEESLGSLDVSLEVPDSEDESSPMGIAAASWRKGWPSLEGEIIAVSDEEDSSNKEAAVKTSQRSKVEEGVFTLSREEAKDAANPTHNVSFKDFFVDNKGVEMNEAQAEDTVVNPFFVSEEAQSQKSYDFLKEVERENCQPPQVSTVTDEAVSIEHKNDDGITEFTTTRLCTSSDDENVETDSEEATDGVHLKKKIKDKVNIFEVSSEESMSSVSVDEIPTISVHLGEDVQEEKTDVVTEEEKTENPDLFSESNNDGVITMPERKDETPDKSVEAEKIEKFVDKLIASLKSQSSAATEENREKLSAVSDESADDSNAWIEEKQSSEKVKQYEVYAVSDEGSTNDASVDKTTNLEEDKNLVRNPTEDETSNLEEGPNRSIQNEVSSVSDGEDGSLKMSTSRVFENSEDSDTSEVSSGEREAIEKDTSDDDSELDFELEIEDVSDEEVSETREAGNDLVEEVALKKDEDTPVVLVSEESSSQSDPGNPVDAVKVENRAACEVKPEMDFEVKFVHKLDKARAGIKSLFEREDGSNSDSSESVKVKVEDDQRQSCSKKPLPNLIPIKAGQSNETVSGIRKDLDMVDTITFKQVKKIFRNENRPQMVVPFVRSMFPERKRDVDKLEAFTSSLRRKFMEARSSLMTSSPDDTCTTPPPSPTVKRKKLLNYSDKRLAAFLNSGRPKRVKKKPKWIIDNFHVDEDLFNYIEDNRKKDVDFKCIDPYRLSQLKLEMPGKRGRKRKVSESQTENATETDDGDDVGAESNPPEMKKRGRKKRRISITIGDEKPTILSPEEIKNEPADHHSDPPNPMPRISVVDVHKMLPKKRFVNLFCGNVHDAVPKTEKSPEPVKEEDVVKSEDAFVTPPPTLKRGRGRPKKHANVVTPETAEPKTKRPRGRPRKNSNSLLSKSEKLDRIIFDLKKNIHVDLDGDEEDETLSDGGDAKKRRGRPSKLKEFVNNVILGPMEPPMTAVVVATAETGPGTPETKRRRGRPPKKSGDEDRKADGEETVKRERKAVDYTALNSGGNDGVKEEEETTEMNDSTLGEETSPGSAFTAKKEGDKKDETPLDLQNRILVTNYVEDIKQEMKKSAEKYTESEEAKKPGFLTCAICYKTMKQNDWSAHKRRSHNNLAWKLGAAPMDLDNVVFVMYILNQAYKDRKPFFCEGCSESKKSVIGFLGHKIQCNKSPEQLEAIKIACNVCERRVMPFSYVEHLRCHKVKEVKLAKQIEEQHRAEVVNSPQNASKKRGAAIKATEMIQSVTKDCTTVEKSVKKLYKKDIPVHDDSYRGKLEEDLKKLGFVKCEGKDCTNITTTISNAVEHYQSCILSLKKKYVCKVCDESFDAKMLVWSHIETVHSDHLPAEIAEYSADPKEAKYSDDETETTTPAKKRTQKTVAAASVDKWKKLYFPKFLDEQPYVKEISPFLNPATYTQTLEFYKLNFCKALYTHFFRKNTWTKLPTDDIVDYLPPLKTSMTIGEAYTKQVNYRKKTDVPSKNFKLFESEIKEKGNSTIFCGGPISSLSWLPTPFELKNCDQVLAVSVLPDPDKNYYLTQTYTGANMIQFWNFGALSNDEPSKKRPELMFCLAHDFGVVWSMAWCPSGCYGDGRLGLLAATCSDSNVHLFTVFQSKSNANKIFKPKPTISLVLNRHSDLNLGGTSYQATSLSWSKAAGHKYLAVGYSNGLAALFKLNVSNLSKYEDTQIVYPVHVFQAHRSTITTIALHHMNDGCKWLASGSTDRIVKFWDLDNTSEPISQDYKKLQVGQLVWHLNWLTVVASPCEVSNLASQATNLSHFRDFAGTVTNSILHTSAPICGLSTCDWANIIVQGSMMGELTGCYVKNFAPFHSELNMRRYYISYNTIKPLEENSADERRATYKAATKGVKLEFNDVVLNTRQVIKPSDVTASVKSNFQEYDSTSYPLQSITVVQINPNRFSFLYTAAGYKAGFVRVSYSSFLSSKYS